MPCDVAALERAIESTDDNVKGLSRVLLQIAPRVAAQRAAAEAGAGYPADLAEPLTFAVGKFSELRAAGQDVPGYLAQQDMYGDSLAPLTKGVLQLLDDTKKSPAKFRQILERYLDAVEAMGDPRQLGLMGPHDAVPAEILQAAVADVMGNDYAQRLAVLRDAARDFRENPPAARPAAAAQGSPELAAGARAPEPGGAGGPGAPTGVVGPAEAGAPVLEAPPAGEAPPGTPSDTPPGAPPPPPPGAPPGGPPPGGAPPPGPTPPGKPIALRVNLRHINADEGVKGILAALNRAQEQRLAEDRAVKPLSAIAAEAAEGVLTPEQALAWDPAGPIMRDAQITRLRQMVADTSAHVHTLAKDVLSGVNDAAWELYHAIAVGGALERVRELESRKAARALRAHGIDITPEELGSGRLLAAELPAVSQALRDHSTIDAQTLANRLLATRPGEQMDLFMRQAVEEVQRGGVRDALYEAWINGILSGPPTSVANFLGNTMTTLWAIPERWVSSHMSRDAQGVQRGEAMALVRGLIDGFWDGLDLVQRAREQYRERGYVNLTGHESAYLPAIRGETFGWQNTSVGRGIDVLGMAVRLPTSLMATTDAFFKAINYRMELRAQSYRVAVSEGLSGDALALRMSEIEAHPAPEIKEAAEQFALVQTFQQDSPTAAALVRAREKLPALRVVLPFVRTPVNIFTYALERSGPLALLSSKMREDLGAGGVRRDAALGKLTLGSLVLATVATAAAQGLLTGAGPEDPDLLRQKRATGWQPYSIKLGDTYYGYNRLDPLGLLVGFVADMTETIGHLPNWQADTLALSAVVVTARNLTSKTYLDGISRAMGALHDPKRALASWAGQFTGSLIPFSGLVHSVERVVDPELREARTMLDRLRRGIPGLSKDLPPQRNLFGEPIYLEGGLGPDLISPIYTSGDKHDAVAAEIDRLQVQLSMPPPVLSGTMPATERGFGVPLNQERLSEGVPLSPAQYDRFVRLAGNELKLSGRGMKDELAHIFKTDAYKRAGDDPDYGGKALMIRQTVRLYREAARSEMLASDEGLRLNLERQKTLRMKASTAQIFGR